MVLNRHQLMQLYQRDFLNSPVNADFADIHGAAQTAFLFAYDGSENLGQMLSGSRQSIDFEVRIVIPHLIQD